MSDQPRVFHDGGIVPGPRGQEVAAILQAGEEILRLDRPPSSQQETP